VPGNAEEVAGAGRTLLPGLIDAHVHVSQLWPIEALQQSLAFGVTTVLDMWTGPPPRGFTGKPALVRLKEIETSDSPNLAAVRTAGTGATARGGHPTQMEGGWAVLVTPSVNGPAEAAAFVASRIAEGSDFIKIIYDDANEAFGLKLPTLNEETITALAAAAHAHGRLAIAHIGTERQARGAISAGVDGLAHLFSGPTVSSEFVELAAKQHVFIIPTLSILYSTCGRPDGPGILREAETLKQVRAEFRIMLSIPSAGVKPSCDGATKAVRQLFDAGVPLLAGTDAPGPGTTYGASLHWELEHLVDAGMAPAAAIAAATSVPSRIFGMTDRGQIKPGMRADLVLVAGDPSKQIRDTRNIVAIWKRGVRFQKPVETK
jgi:imidazolonepropionase-like amidohydrolase